MEPVQEILINIETKQQVPYCSICLEEIIGPSIIDINLFPKGELCRNCQNGWYSNLKLELLKSLELTPQQLDLMALKYLEKWLKHSKSKHKPRYQKVNVEELTKSTKPKLDNEWDRVLEPKSDKYWLESLKKDQELEYEKKAALRIAQRTFKASKNSSLTGSEMALAAVERLKKYQERSKKFKKERS